MGSLALPALWHMDHPGLLNAKCARAWETWDKWAEAAPCLVPSLGFWPTTPELSQGVVPQPTPPPAWASLSGKQLQDFPGYLSARLKAPILPIKILKNAKKVLWDLWGPEGRCQQLSCAHNSAIGELRTDPQLLHPFTATTGIASCLPSPGADVAALVWRWCLFTGHDFMTFS